MLLRHSRGGLGPITERCARQGVGHEDLVSFLVLSSEVIVLRSQHHSLKSAWSSTQRAARIIYNLPHDTPTDEVYRHSNWTTLTFNYKLRLIKLFHSVFIGEAPAALSYLTNRLCTAYNLRRCNNVIVSRFN